MVSKSALGLYFTDNFLQISKVSQGGDKITLFGQTLLTQDQVIGGEVKNENLFVATLKRLLESTKPHPVSPGAEVILGVNDSNVFLREFTVPKVVGKEVEDAIAWQIRSLLPVLPQEVETDWKIIGRDANDNIEVLLIAIPKKTIASYVRLAQTAGLKVISIEPVIFANLRVIKPELLKGKNQLLIYLGDNFAEFAYITNGQPRFSDFLPDAEVVKKGGLLAVATDYVTFANSKHSSRTIQEIIVSGNQEKVTQAVVNLKNQILPVITAQSILAPSQIDSSPLHTSHGLSLKPLMGNHLLNLLPLEQRLTDIHTRLSAIWRTLLMVLIGLTAICLISLGFLYQNLLTRQNQLLQAKTAYTNSLSSTEKTNLVKQIQDFNLLVDQLTLLQATTGGENSVLNQLALSVPTGVTLTSLTYTQGQTASWLVTGNANSRPLVLEFYQRLLSQPNFSNAQLYFGSLEKETAITFRIATPTP